ncbi:MAG: ABC-F family ATP-binding cassette domain-containing protein [Verrucomicrobiales bacterium]|nr:ABC-F family ATP-binding cassette domain-containing protein [Verrucomicrobiales bacterium]
MLALSQVSKAYAGRTLFSGVSLQINRDDRIGLVGPNGAGKSTLFSIILGETTPDDGKILVEKGTRLGFLPQESAPAGEETVLDLATGHAGDHRWEMEPKAKTILRGLAFRESDFLRPARTLSGGWVMRAHLARLLVQEPDLLLLDEPTNHLDLESLIWFQDYLKHRYPGAILMISHDREFLNQLVGSIVEISRQRLGRYRGNFEDYLREKEAREMQHAAAYENQQREIARLQDFADRFRAKATKAAQAQSKLKQIERMEKIEAPLASEKTVAFRFPQPPRSGQRVVTLRDIHFAYGETPVYQGMNFEAERGQRTVLVGPNGSGKSTLLKLLAAVLTPQQGVRDLGHNVKAGYFSQYRGEMFQPQRTVLEEAMDLEIRVSEQTARTILGAFLFRGDDVFKPVAVLSGGEKTRLALCKMLLAPPNLLLMDEPTTHLDIGSIDALVRALRDYEGTLVFISHDVYFIRAIASSVLHIGAGLLTSYAGDYQYYLDKTRAESERAALTAGARLGDARAGQASAPGAAERESIFKSKEQKRAEAEARQTKSRQRKEQERQIVGLEEEIAALEEQQQQLVTELEDPETYASGGAAMQLNRDLLAVQESLQRLTASWEAAQQALETWMTD